MFAKTWGECLFQLRRTSYQTLHSKLRAQTHAYQHPPNSTYTHLHTNTHPPALWTHTHSTRNSPPTHAGHMQDISTTSIRAFTSTLRSNDIKPCMFRRKATHAHIFTHAPIPTHTQCFSSLDTPSTHDLLQLHTFATPILLRACESSKLHRFLSSRYLPLLCDCFSLPPNAMSSVM